MSAVLMTLFAVSVLGALGMAIYGLRVLVGRWEQPRQARLLHSVPKLAPVGPFQPQPQAQPMPQPQAQPMPQPQAQPMPQPQAQPMPPAPPPVWVHPVGGTPAPMAPLVGVATPPPLRLPEGGFPAPAEGGFPAPAPAAPLAHPSVAPQPPHPIAVPPAPPPRAPSPGPSVSGTISQPPRLARGSISPDLADDDVELEPDTDPGVPVMMAPESLVTQGPRFSVIRSSRR